MNSDNLTPAQRAKLDRLKKQVIQLERMMAEYRRDVARDQQRREWWKRGETPPLYDPKG